MAGWGKSCRGRGRGMHLVPRVPSNCGIVLLTVFQDQAAALVPTNLEVAALALAETAAVVDSGPPAVASALVAQVRRLV